MSRRAAGESALLWSSAADNGSVEAMQEGRCVNARWFGPERVDCRGRHCLQIPCRLWKEPRCVCVCCCGSGAAGVAWAAWLAHAVWALEVPSLPVPGHAGRRAVYWKFERRVAERRAARHTQLRRGHTGRNQLRINLAEAGEASQLPNLAPPFPWTTNVRPSFKHSQKLYRCEVSLMLTTKAKAVSVSLGPTEGNAAAAGRFSRVSA